MGARGHTKCSGKHCSTYIIHVCTCSCQRPQKCESRNYYPRPHIPVFRPMVSPFTRPFHHSNSFFFSSCINCLYSLAAFYDPLEGSGNQTSSKPLFDRYKLDERADYTNRRYSRGKTPNSPLFVQIYIQCTQTDATKQHCSAHTRTGRVEEVNKQFRENSTTYHYNNPLYNAQEIKHARRM